MKTQTIRVLDVFLIGPLMIYIADKSENVNPVLKNLLSFFGFSTILYNAYNYMEKEKEMIK